MKLKLFFLLLFYASATFAQSYSLNKVGTTTPNNINIVKHAFYEIGFDINHRLPAWTYYSLTKAHLQLAVLERKGSFVKDPYINTAQAGNEDYSGSGYDKGHLVPCEDMSFSEQAMKETFYYSNCAPQTTELNRGAWKVLEELVREWATDFGEAIVICGPVFKPVMSKMGVHDIPIPDLYYKIILLHKEKHYTSLAFLMPNSNSGLNTPVNYTCTVDSVEKITGLDFFTELPDKMEEQFEGKINVNDWNWKIHHTNTRVVLNKSDSSTHSINPRNTISEQCKGKTKKGKRCKKKTTSENGFCDLHKRN